MKFIATNAIYLQKYYINILLKSSLVTKIDVPISICNKVDSHKFEKYDNKYFIKFTKDEEIKFLKEADWIPNFSEYIKKTNDEIKDEIASLDNETAKLNDWYSNLNSIEKNENYAYGTTKVTMITYNKESLNDILTLKQNIKTIPTDYVNYLRSLGIKVKDIILEELMIVDNAKIMKKTK